MDGGGGGSNERRRITQQICATAPRTFMFFGLSLSQVLESTSPRDCLTGQRGAKFILSTATGRLFGMQLKHWFRGASQVMWLLIGFILSVEAPRLK